MDPVSERLCKLPVFQPVATRLLQILPGDNIEVSEVTHLIQMDPALGAEVLLLANSPLFGFTSKIQTLSHAVVILGLERTKRLLMTVALRAYMKGTQNDPVVKRCWHHSLACAVIAGESSSLFGVPQDRAYTAGLMHDIGRLGLLAAYPKEYRSVLEAVHEKTSDVLRAEEQALGTDHCKAGLWLTRTWGFPADFLETGESHHEARTARRDLVSSIRLACNAADALGYDTVSCLYTPAADKLEAFVPADQRDRFRFDTEDLRKKIKEAIQSLE